MMRRFGIELELIAPRAQAGNALQHASDQVNTLGIACRVTRYGDRNYTTWTAKPDMSLRPQDRAVEVVSRTLPASPDSYEEVRRVVTRLDGEGYTVNVKCGMHVHVNVSDLPIRTRQLIVLRYNECRADYDAMMPASRRAGANGYCSQLADRPELERAINSGSDAWRRGHGRHSEVVNTAFIYDHDARLEFRQAAGTCDPVKALAWVRYLQEMVEEVARRARGATFATAAMRTATTPVRPVAPLHFVPRMHHGSDNYRALQQLCDTGSVTTAWALQNQMEARVLRRIIVGFRRHGAGLRTVSTAAGPEYHLTSVAAPCTARDIFAPVATPQPVLTPNPFIAAPVPAVATITAADFVRYDFFAGLSAESVTWVRSRRDIFAAEQPAPIV